MANHLVKPQRPSHPLALLLLSLFILLAFALRLYNLDGFSFWTDEGLTPLRSGYSISEILSNSIVIQEGVTRDTHPPFFYLLIHFSRKALGETDFAYRYPSLLAGVLLIPLLFQFGRRLQGMALGLTAALLAAVNPLQIWYANEARMYTLFVLLMAAASYVLWRALTRPQWTRRYLLVYLALVGLAFYTHYVAVFLIAAHGLFWIWLLLRQGQRRLLLGAAVTGLIIAIPLIPFTLPRLFTGAEASYRHVSPPVMFQDVVHAFSLGLTADYSEPVALLDAGIFVLLLVGIYAARSWQRRLFLLLYLLAAVFGLMLGSLIKPMYQGARHIMVGSPALLLLLGMGVVWLMTQATIRTRYRSAWLVAAALAVVVVLAGPAFSLSNLYFNPRYAKDDFRAVIQYAEQRAGEQDVIVYHNAVLLPLHEHYRSRLDVAVTALPVYPHAATAVEQQLAALSQQYERIWFVSDPPADGRDENGITSGWLEAHLTTVDFQAFHARTTLVDVFAYDTAASSIAELPAGARALALTWDDLPSLRGIQLQFNQPASQPTLWLALFWQGQPAPADTLLRFSLVGPDGKEWLAHGQGLADAAAPWITDTLVRRAYYLPLPPGMPPGTYTLQVQPDTGPDSPVRAVQSLAEVELAASHWWPAKPAIASRSLLFANGLSLQAVEPLDKTVRPGHSIPVTLYWQADRPLSLENVHYQLDVIGPDGALVRTQTALPGASWLKVWPAGVLIREDMGLYFPPETRPGRYRLRWRLLNENVIAPGRPSWRPWTGQQLFLGEVTVEPWPLVKNLPAGTTVVQATFGDAIELYGYDLDEPQSGVLPLTLYWQAHAVPDDFYVAFVHLISAADGELRSQLDYIPVNGLRPTTGWREGEVLTDPYTLPLPADMPPGQYYINVGLYNPDTWERLPVIYKGELQAHNLLMLTTLTLQ